MNKEERHENEGGGRGEKKKQQGEERAHLREPTVEEEDVESAKNIIKASCPRLIVIEPAELDANTNPFGSLEPASVSLAVLDDVTTRDESVLLDCTLTSGEEITVDAVNSEPDKPGGRGEAERG